MPVQLLNVAQVLLFTLSKFKIKIIKFKSIKL